MVGVGFASKGRTIFASYVAVSSRAVFNLTVQCITGDGGMVMFGESDERVSAVGATGSEQAGFCE